MGIPEVLEAIKERMDWLYARVRAYDWDDYTCMAFTANEARYYVGRDALDPTTGDPHLVDLFPDLEKNMENNQPGFTSLNTLLYATENCWVRFNGESRVRHFIRAGNFYTFYSKIDTIYVVQDVEPGELDIHAEGRERPGIRKAKRSLKEVGWVTG